MHTLIPLFPLSAHLLPGGRLALRIFEPRYVRMVKEACAKNTGIGMCMLDAKAEIATNQHILPIGTYARIIDFDLLKDGLLGITVEGERCFTIGTIHTEADGLRVGECEWLDGWDLQLEHQQLQPMVSRLKEIFATYPDISDLYNDPKFNDASWVVYRWLELLPIDAPYKQQLLSQQDGVKALEYLTQLVK